MAEHSFGGSWTQDKLERVSKYLPAYTGIFTANPRAQYFNTYYVDAFAGTGYRTKASRNGRQKSLFPDLAGNDVQGLLKGSARIALEVEPPFDNYLFIEQDPKYADELRRLQDEFPDKAGQIQVIPAEANEYLKIWCKETMNWKKSRAVMFLDPYGMQVDWSLIEAIAQTKAIDLWLLFPLGMAVSRLLTKGRKPPPEWADALTRFFGCGDWRREFYRDVGQQSLFEEETDSKRVAGFGNIGQFFVKRLKTVFPAVAENPLPLMNSKGNPLYMLCFAAGNTKGAPTALKIANHILKV